MTFFPAGLKRKAADLKSLQKHSVSSVAKELDTTLTHQYLKPMPMYAHWLAVEMLKVHESAKRQLHVSAKTPTAMSKFNVANKSFVINTSAAKELDATSTCQYLKSMPVYAHWLAVEMLKVHESAKRQLLAKTPATMLKFNVANESFVINTSAAKELDATSICQYHKPMLVYAHWLAVEMPRFMRVKRDSCRQRLQMLKVREST